jgi:hypothetical protein
MTMRIKITFAVLAFCLVFAQSASGAGKTDRFVLKERTHENLLFTIHKNTSVDYRSTVLIRFAGSPDLAQAGIKTEVEIVRKNGRTLELPSRYILQNTDSTAQEVRINLWKWAAEPGDRVHLLIQHDLDYPYVFERYLSVKKHGFGGNLSFPIFSVQRNGDHPGSLGAGISYAMKYVQAEKNLLNYLGVGPNISLLDFESDQKVEIGLGVVITFPDDLFQIGFGKNLTVKRDSGYYFVGINLPGIIDKIGL